ncbi:MAG: hypothetical protein JXB04_09120 [Kiritimatiellae bacterium]|nr:hypothetical protein [Kiritimatiellia bacterium]
MRRHCSRGRRPQQTGVFLAGIAVALCGYAGSPPVAVPLTDGQKAKLLEQARQPGNVGITVEKEGEEIILEGVSALPPGRNAVLPFSAPRLSHQAAPQVDILLNGSQTRALLASGLPRSLVDYRRATRAGVVPLAEARRTPPGIGTLELLAFGTDTPAGHREHFLGFSPTFHVRDLPIYKLTLGILNDRGGLRSFTWLVDADADVALGHDFLRLFTRITVDYPNRQVSLATGGIHRPDRKRLVAVLPLVTVSGVPAIKAVLDGKGPFWMALDTAGDYGLWIPHRVAEALDIPDLLTPPPAPRKRGARGDPLSVPAGAHTLRVAGLELPDIAVTVATVSPPGGEPPYALLGHAILSRYIVTFDYRQEKIYLENP